MDEPLILNLADAPAWRQEDRVTILEWEPEDDRWPDTGINVQIMEPGRPNCLYHREGAQEDFLVLYGECIVIVDGEERPLRQWDLFHCPAGVAHVFVGAGERPCAVLMIGSRGTRDDVVYPVNETAAKHGASVDRETDDPETAYAEWNKTPWERVPSPWGREPA